MHVKKILEDYPDILTFVALASMTTGLKLFGVVGWSWWWVVSPLLVPLAIVLMVWIFGAILFALIMFVERF